VFKEFEANALQSLRKHVKKLHFLPGERISRAGNLEYEMHIIVRGKVWVAHESLIYGCCLHKNEYVNFLHIKDRNCSDAGMITAGHLERRHSYLIMRGSITL